MYVSRVGLALALLVFLGSGSLSAQKKKPESSDDGYIPQVLPENKHKKQKKEDTQVLPLLPELPNSVVADTDKLSFEVTPLSAKGLLSQQTRETLKNLLHSSRGTIVKLRAFVAGSGDLRRVTELTAEMFTEKHQPLPALSVLQVGGLPLAGAQIVMEATEMEKRVVNPNGIAFISGQSASSISQSLEHLKTALRGAGLEPSDTLRITCFVSSLDDEKSGHLLMSGNFPNAAVNYVQMQREQVTPAAECEAVARLRSAPSKAVNFLNPAGLDKSPNYSQVALVNSPKLVITGTQLAFGDQENDLKLAFERLEKSLAGSGGSFSGLVMSHVYLTSSGIANKVRSVRTGYYNREQPPASTMLPFEALPSLDAQMGLDAIAVTSWSSGQH
ncbi:MAG TPA: Rid family hydrolase [Bryobacteraceae bacterium]|nr:Rid family hydrolase [Bryobacteraceae bacterium]